MLQRHIEYCECHDKWFKQFWCSLSDKDRTEFLELGNKIENGTNSADPNFQLLHDQSVDLLSRKLIVIPETGFRISQNIADWSDFVMDKNEKQKVFDFSRLVLLDYIEKSQVPLEHLFGNLKSDESIAKSIEKRKRLGYYPEYLYDIWDLVRFRIVVQTPNELAQLGVKIWRDFYRKIYRCRNYYFNPKLYSHDTNYRAIHFLIMIQESRIIEVQLVTKAREWIGRLDRAVLFKKDIPPIDEEHVTWLMNYCCKANILDASYCKLDDPYI